MKKILAKVLVEIGVDRLGRRINQHKLLVVMYHGVTRNNYDPPVWTQLPEAVFRNQIEFLVRNYHPVTLGQVEAAIDGHDRLPERAVLVTFDDGLQNNYSVARPILHENGVPAVIFLTTDFIGTESFLWVDDLYCFLVESVRLGIELPLDETPETKRKLTNGNVWGAYVDLVEAYKRMPDEMRTTRLKRLEAVMPLDRISFAEDFGLLDWRQVLEMDKDGLIDFGVHTATHTILTQMRPGDEKREIFGAKESLEERLGREVAAFCYPNGCPGIDFLEKHKLLLKKAGFRCAFTTKKALFNPTLENPFSISRIPAGNDLTSNLSIFRLNTSGVACLRRDR